MAQLLKPKEAWRTRRGDPERAEDGAMRVVGPWSVVGSTRGNGYGATVRTPRGTHDHRPGPNFRVLTRNSSIFRVFHRFFIDFPGFRGFSAFISGISDSSIKRTGKAVQGVGIRDTVVATVVVSSGGTTVVRSGV